MRPVIPTLASISILAVAANAIAHPIPAFKLEFPAFYVQAGLEWNPPLGPHPFLLPPPVSWDSPQTLTMAGGSVASSGSSTHLIALHAGEAAPATTWTYSISRAIPAGFGAAETRIRRLVAHPGGGGHVDAYMAVVGAIVGTAPGAPVGPNLVMLGGSMGKHMNNPPPSAPQPMYGGCALKPRNGLPSPVNQDYPAGEVLAILEAAPMHLSMMLMVSGIPGGSINNIFVRSSPGGPILIDLKPMMQMNQVQQYDTIFTMHDMPVPAVVWQAISQGNGNISVMFPPALHPDGELTGLIANVPCKTGDINCDGATNVDDLLAIINAWGPCPPPCPPSCPADLNGDCFVNVDDLLIAINNWG